MESFWVGNYYLIAFKTRRTEISNCDRLTHWTTAIKDFTRHCSWPFLEFRIDVKTSLPNFWKKKKETTAQSGNSPPQVSAIGKVIQYLRILNIKRRRDLTHRLKGLISTEMLLNDSLVSPTMPNFDQHLLTLIQDTLTSWRLPQVGTGSVIQSISVWTLMRKSLSSNRNQIEFWLLLLNCNNSNLTLMNVYSLTCQPISLENHIISTSSLKEEPKLKS